MKDDIVTCEEAQAIVDATTFDCWDSEERVLRFIDQAESLMRRHAATVEAERRAREQTVATMTENARLRAERDAARELVLALRGGEPLDVVLARVERAVAEWDVVKGAQGDG